MYIYVYICIYSFIYLNRKVFFANILGEHAIYICVLANGH